MDINQLKSRKAYKILSEYDGENPYILSLKNDILKNNSKHLTTTQSSYIVKNHNKEPKFMDKIVEINEYLGVEIKKLDKLDYIPQRLKIDCFLGETEKAYHVIGRVSSKAKPKMYFLSKNNVYEDLNFELLPVNIDFVKYNKRLMERRGYELLPHQKEAVTFLLERNGAILADEMGVAKTLPTIVAALHTKFKRILIVCPSSVKINWEREINTFSDNTTIVEGRIWTQSRFTIINYDILQNFHTLESKIDPNDPPTYISRELVNANFDLIIVDEAHNLRNKKSIRGEIVSELCSKFGNPKVWLLSGTPVANRPKDFYNLLKLIRCNVADDYPFYMKRYCNGRQFYKKTANGKTKKTWLVNGSANLEELAQRTKHLLLRRLKVNVVDMPQKQIIRQYQKLSESSRKEYESVWDKYILERKAEKKRGNIEKELVELVLLRRFVAMEAIESTYELAMEAINQDKKVIIFTTFNNEQEELMQKFGNIAVCHNGSMNINEKQFSVDAFQTNDKIKVFIGNVTSAGVGITLTAGSVTIFNSYSWIPGENDQAEDRSWRIGQVNDCNVYYQVFIDTISEKILNTLSMKRDMINQIIANEEEIKIMNERIMDLIID